MKKKEIGELAALIGLEDVKEENKKEKDMERWARRGTNHFTKNVESVVRGNRQHGLVWQ